MREIKPQLPPIAHEQIVRYLVAGTRPDELVNGDPFYQHIQQLCTTGEQVAIYTQWFNLEDWIDQPGVVTLPFPPEVIQSTSEPVRHAVLSRNYNFLVTYYWLFLTDSSPDIRKLIASKGLGLDVLAKDSDTRVRNMVATFGQWDKLLNDPNALVAFTAKTEVQNRLYDILQTLQGVSEFDIDLILDYAKQYAHHFCRQNIPPAVPMHLDIQQVRQHWKELESQNSKIP